jgi:hypothetical protein
MENGAWSGKKNSGSIQEAVLVIICGSARSQRPISKGQAGLNLVPLRNGVAN